MKQSRLIHTLILYLSILAVFFWTSHTQLSAYNLQLTALLTLIYFSLRVIGSASSQHLIKPFSTAILMTITLLLVFSTGSVKSPLFFLLDFLLFALALLTEPFQAGAVSLMLVIIFVFQNYSSLSPEALINISSLIFITPLAIIFGRNYLTTLSQTGKIHILSQVIKKEETDSLMWVSTSVKPSLSSILNSVSDIVIYLNTQGGVLNSVPENLTEKLRGVQRDLSTLYSSTTIFTQTIEETSDKIDD